MDKDLVQQLRRGDAFDGQLINCKLDMCNCAVMENAAAEIEHLLNAIAAAIDDIENHDESGAYSTLKNAIKSI